MLARYPITLVPRFILLLTLVSSVFSAGLVTHARAAEEPNLISLDTGNQSSLSTPILDDFNRADGSLGGNWSGATSGYAISSSQVSVNAGGNIYWQSTAFGVDQEAFVTLTHIDPATPEINLILKGQSNTSISPGQISVAYSPSGNSVQVWSHHSVDGWQTHGTPVPVVFVDGDEFGARALSSGQIEIYKNGSLVDVRSVTDWSYYAQGGYIGFAAFGPGTTTLDNFGGGTIGGSPTLTPIVTSTPVATNTPLPTSGGSSFPSTNGLDDFNRVNGSLGGNWSGATSGFALSSNQASVNAGGNIYWQSSTFGVDQEAFVTLTHIDPTTPEINLILKGQSTTSITPGQISVQYSPSGNFVQVWSHHSVDGWQTHGSAVSVVFADGDEFGVRALSSGQIEIYKNGLLLAVRSVTDWGYYAQGGYIGFAAFGPGTTTLDNFGGGTIGGSPTLTPTATTPPACTDPLTCNPVTSVHSRWVCNVENCTTEPWIGTVINWPSWSAYSTNARQGQYSRTTYTPEGELLTPYMGSWADGCQVTAVSGIVLIIEWQRGTDVWRATYLQPGQSYTIDLISPEDNALLESPDTPDIFSVSLSNCTPQNIYGDATPTSTGAITATASLTPIPTLTPTFTLTATNTPTFTPTNTSTSTSAPTFTQTPSRTPTATFTRTSTATNTRTFTPIAPNTSTRTPTATPTPSYSYGPLYLSLRENQTVGGIAASNEDILKFDGQTWSIFFDGSDVGASSVDLSAFSILDSDSILMSFRSSLTLSGISVNPQDVVRFDAISLGNTTAGTFSMYFDGSDVGLTTTDETVDSMDRLPDGRLLISTSGGLSVGNIVAGDEDVLAFTPSSLGNFTSGTWAIYFDGSDAGLADSFGEDIDALDVAANGNIYLSTTGDFAVSGVSGFDEDVFVCVPVSVGSTTACNYSSTLYFNGSTWGLSANDVDAFNFLESAAAPTATPANTATNTATRTPTATATFTRTPTSTVTPPSYSYRPLYLSLVDGQMLGGVVAADEDILKFDGQAWSMFFDGSDVGASAVDLSAFSILDSNSILMSFSSAVTLNGLFVTPQDVVQFDASSLGNTTTGTFSMYFDGGDVGLTTAEESIDSVDLIAGPWLLISTTGSVSVTGVSGSDEDVLAFDPSSLGSSTSGTWTMGFDGSDVGLGDTSDEDVDALDVVGSTTVYLSTTGDFAVSGVSGSDEDIFVCVITAAGSTTACNYSSTLYFNGSTWGLSANDVDAFNFLETGP